MIWWWLGGLLALAVLGLVLYWQLIIAEGIYLGQKIVTLLYDWTAHKYNDIKEFDPQEENDFLATPLSQALGRGFRGVILDVATGTGRLPQAMQRQADFQGRVIGVDHSRRMLAVARQNAPNVPLVVADAMRLPFARNSIAAVTCLEALEFFPNPAGGLQELVQVLSPGGVLLTTHRIGWETKLMPGRTWQAAELRAILAQLPLTNVLIIPWLNIYQQVWARKTGRLESKV